MKNTKCNIILLVLFMVLFSCEKDFLDREPLDIISSDAVYNDKGYVESLIYRLYNFMPVGFPGRGQKGNDATTGVKGQPDIDGENYPYGFTSMLDCQTDLAITKSTWIETWTVIRTGNLDATNNRLDNWAALYKGIYLANTLLANIEKGDLPADFKKRIIAEARFIKAFQYFDLARRYGDVPLIKELQSIDDDLLLKRTPVAEIYKYVDEEFTAATIDLPAKSELKSSDLGRATKEAAWAFNGRAQLFAKNYARSAELSKKVIDAAAAGSYTLFSNYEALFYSYGGNPEVIFETIFDGVNKGHGVDKIMLPFSYRADWGAQCNPTQEFVDSYEMKNGLPITDPTSGYNDRRPYENRDSRLAATVLYQGAVFIGRPMDVIFPAGLDAPNRSGLHTVTGYYIRKFMDPNAPFGVEFGNSKQSWIEMRLAEVLLNYAEAQNEAVGPDDSVYKAINDVRTRANQPDIPSGLSKIQMFDRIVQERKIELALEGHRFWDLKRWNMGVQVLNNKKFTGMKIKSVDPITGEMDTERFPIDNRPITIYSSKFNLFPVPQSEIEKNPNLLPQNSGY